MYNNNSISIRQNFLLKDIRLTPKLDVRIMQNSFHVSFPPFVIAQNLSYLELTFDNRKVNANQLKKYCLLVRYLFIFDSFGASQAVYRNLWWYIKSPLRKVISLQLGWSVFFCPGSQKNKHHACPIEIKI